MHLSRPSKLLVIRLKELLLRTHLQTRDPMLVVFVIVRHDLTHREVAIRELLRHGNGVVDSLLPYARAPAAEHAEDRVVLLALAKASSSSTTITTLLLLLFVLLLLCRGSTIFSLLTLCLLLILARLRSCWLTL